jgi:hypothetical protein
MRHRLAASLANSYWRSLHCHKSKIHGAGAMNNFNKLRDMLRDMEDSLGIWGDIIGVVSLFLTFYLLFFFAGVL